MENRSRDQHTQHTKVMIVCVVSIAILGLLAGIRPGPCKSDEIPVVVKDQVNIPANPLADGTAYYVTLYPPELGSSPWMIGEDSICDLLFRAPGDKRKWLKLNIKKKEHFKGFYIGITDYRGGLSNDVIEAVNFKQTDQINLKTQSFKADINFIEAETSSDPDPEQPYEKAFKKVILRIIIAEQFLGLRTDRSCPLDEPGRSPFEIFLMGFGHVLG